MNEKRLQEIDRRVNAIQYVFNGWDIVPLTIAEANELTTEIRSLREALAFYADASNYKDFIPGHESLNGVWNIDNRYRARVALGLEPAPETPQD